MFTELLAARTVRSVCYNHVLCVGTAEVPLRGLLPFWISAFENAL